MRTIVMTPLSVSAQIAKLRKERMALEKQEQALINKTYREAIAQIKVIMKGSGAYSGSTWTLIPATLGQHSG
jgi:predicted  nucleic acid-binding Zn-ribbon protein